MQTSDLHVHDFAVRLDEFVAHLQGGLKADLGFLRRDHRLFNADGGVVELHLALQPADFSLTVAHRLERLRQCRLKSAAVDLFRLGQGLPLSVTFMAVPR